MAASAAHLERQEQGALFLCELFAPRANPSASSDDPFDKGFVQAEGVE
jgi:hypothetical protein